MSVLQDIEMSLPTRKPNYIKIPVTSFSMTEEGVEQFNNTYLYLRDYCKNFNPIKRTKSGGISISHIRLPQWDIRSLKSCVEVTVLAPIGFFRIQLRTIGSKDSKEISGSLAFRKFKNICEKFDIDLSIFAISDGEEVKKTFSKPMIGLTNPDYANKVFYNAYHIDLNSSYMAGIAESHPELREPIEYIYKNRKDKPYFKDILTHTWGYMQSSIINYKYAHLSKDGLDSNNRKLTYLTEQLKKQGFTVIAYNSDGIWYNHPYGKKYHDKYEGTELGMWKHDHNKCIYQAKSNGAYHYIEDGKCHTVLRGRTRLDRIKPRDDWSWEDLYRMDDLDKVMKIYFREDVGAYIKYE